MFRKIILSLLPAALLVGCADNSKPVNLDDTNFTTETNPPAPPKADPQMQVVLDALAGLHPKPIAALTAPEARLQPDIGKAVQRVMAQKGMNLDPEPVGTVVASNIPSKPNDLPIRIYTPKGAGPFPVLYFIHGGGWVLATIDSYDASCRALCNKASCIVVSIEYRKAPENKFPAAHEDVYTGLQWVMNNAASFKGDPTRVAIAGESAGGNMAAAACMMAKERHGLMPVAQVLIYPVAGTDFKTPSYDANANARPLNRDMMKWFFKQYTSSDADMNDKHLALVKASADDLKGLPAATIITDEIDPLMSEGQAYADHLKAAGVDTRAMNYTGVTHEFFGLSALLDRAKEAQSFAADRLKHAFGAQ